MNLRDLSAGIPELLQQMEGAKLAVFGDFCVDAYWELAANGDERSIETGLPVRHVRSQKYSLGGAGSVLANLIDMGVGSVRAIGVAGTDIFSNTLRCLLEECAADTSGFLSAAEWTTMVYAKPYLGDKEDNRIDFGAFNSIEPELEDALLQELSLAAAQSGAVILNQQVAGGLSSPKTIERINEIIRAYPSCTFLVDARHHASHYRGAALKLNMAEAARYLKRDSDELTSDACAKSFAVQISSLTGQPAFLTRGELGLVIAMNEEAVLIPGLQVIDRTDAVGAGDAVVAALAGALAVGASPVLAGVLANIAAMITVRKVQSTGTASVAEILKENEELNYVFRPELAKSQRKAKYLPNTEIELTHDLPRDLAIKHCIFDHDGTLSVLREGWELIMEPMMLRAILGAQHDAVDATVFKEVLESARVFIDRTTGIQTLVQMKGLAELVRQWGFVPEDEILDEHGYKHVYNVELLKMVKERVEKLERGELEPRDFQIKNADLLLRELYARGVKLYLASGTDESDVIAEAEAMGYADLFEGRIFGAVGDINVEAKKIVLERIIRENNLAGHEFATFGDGPVELRETQRRGGLCVGVASDELRRFGLNPAKRKRLIRAGADIIVPDYSQLTALLKTLQLN